MFPYSFGVQAPTKTKAKSDLAAQADKLAKAFPDEAGKYSDHVKTVLATAGVLIDLLPDDDKETDVAASAAGHLSAQKSADEKKDDDVLWSTVTVYAGRQPADPSKYAKPDKDAKPEKDATVKPEAKVDVKK
jgi:hypothetical protein